MSDLKIGDIFIVGPFVATWRVVIEGYCIPHLTAIVSDDRQRVSICLDGRFLQEGTPDEMARWLPMIANALAIGAGYPWYGAQSKERPFAPKAMEIGGDGKPEIKLVH